MAADASTVQKLITDLQISGSTSPVRLASNDSGMKPLQINLNSAEAEFAAIGNFIKLRSLNEWTDKSISRDRTPIIIFRRVKEVESVVLTTGKISLK
ncbi:hypothetical protein Zmor_005446 [Zophobas morio]|uniref:Uncharacterized protein n=1 Tax=Zophobas morio TaxID=2755281 RepID=A0AA38IUK3_9CUCU|nr:hypothetical protein Zmor_005446 [Zophobas morio]